MHFEILAAVRDPRSDAHAGAPDGWPRIAPVRTKDWIRPGDLAAVQLVTQNGFERWVELPWGWLDPQSECLDFLADGHGKSFARPCLLPVGALRQECDVGDAPGSVVEYRPTAGHMLAGFWISDDPHFFRPIAFKLVTVRAGPDIAAFCSRQPLLIGAEHCAAWLSPQVPTGNLQRTQDHGTFKVVEVASAPKAD